MPVMLIFFVIPETHNSGPRNGPQVPLKGVIFCFQASQCPLPPKFGTDYILGSTISMQLYSQLWAAEGTLRPKQLV